MPNNSLPYSLEAERSVLCCIIIDQDEQMNIISALKVDDFLTESHKTIFREMTEIMASNSPVDFVTLTDHLQKKGLLEKAGGISYLSDLARVVPSSAMYNDYINIVTRDGTLRSLISASNTIIEDAMTSLDHKKSLMKAEKAIFDISQKQEKKGLEIITPYYDTVINKFEKIASDKNYLLGLKTGFKAIDFYTNGLHKGNLIILAARPSVGKSALAMNIVENAALNYNASCAVFALEMTKEELAQRLLCSSGSVKMEDALKGKLLEKDKNSVLRLMKAKKRLSEAKIYIDESTGVTPQEILSKCRKLKANSGLDLIVIDHIQLMQAAKKTENRQQEVTSISKDLKALAKELDVPVLALSQLSRLVTSRKGGKPMLSDLRESGAIEQDADLVLFIHRPDKDAPEEEKRSKNNSEIADIIIAKNRNGPCASFNLVFKGEYVKYIDFEAVDDKGNVSYGRPSEKPENENNSNKNMNKLNFNDEDIPPEESEIYVDDELFDESEINDDN